MRSTKSKKGNFSSFPMEAGDFFCLKREKIKIYRFNDLKFISNRFKRLVFEEKYDIIRLYHCVLLYGETQEKIKNGELL